MDKQGVSLPSAAQTEAQTILEKQNLIKVPKGASGDKSSAVVEASDDESESDNEDIVDVVKKDVNLDNEFEKIVPFKFKRLSEESIDEVDHEIAEILQEAAPLGKEVQSEVEKTQFEIKAITPEEEVSTELENSRFDVQVVDEKAEAAELIKKEIEESEAELNTVTPTNELKEPETDKLTSSANENTKLEATEPSISDSNANKTIIDGEPMPKEEDESVNENTDDKPPVPIQTYLWEDVKRSKEQGGYPWTHLYKEPLGPDDDPQSILSYKQSPRAARKASNDQGTPKSQKKVRIQDEIEIQETENYIQDLSDDETIKSGDDNLDSDVEEEVPEAPAEEKSEPKGILKRSQKLLENIKPNTSKFDSGSLKKKIKNPFTKIKNMADEQFKRVKAARPSIKKLSVGKDEIVLNEEVKILKLKESPVSEHREYPSYVVQHQDSEDSVEIMKLDESPSIKRRENEAHVTPDEIIELPTAKQSDDKIEQQREGTVESREISIRSSSSPLKTVSPVVPKKREHQYEDIEDYISKITDDGESVERAPPAPDTNIHHYHKAGSIDDPIFDEFSRQFNKNIRLSLSAQDDKMRQELAKKIPKIEELEKQISDEDREEKIEGSLKQMHLLAPISSIDSTSSDEASKAHLSILAEESESDSNKKKSFDDSTFDRDLSSFERDVESLKNDGSDVSMTLIEDELKNLEERQEVKQIENFVELMTVDAFIKPEETEISVEPKAPEVELSEIENSVETKIQTSEIPEAFETQEAPEAADSETLEAQEAEKSDEPEQVVKEDVIVKKEAEATSPIKVSSRWSKMSDHEYEPIGEPQLDETVTDLDHPDSQKRKTSDTDAGNEKKFLRTPTQESDDNISAQDFQNEIENRFFTKEIEPMVDDEAHAVHQENTFDEAVIIDETPVKRDVPRKRNFIKNAQESGMNFHKKIKAQAGIFKNKIKKKPKEKPVAVEIAQENIEPPADEEIETETIVETIETVDVSTSEAPTKSKSFKMPNFKKPTMPKFNKVERPSMPDLKLGGRFSNLGKKLGRSKSMKEESVVTDTTSYTTPEASTAEPTKKKFDFGTYPRMIRDKFKRQKVPERSDQSVRSETPPTIEFTNVSGQFAQRGPVASRWPEYDSESGKYQQFNSETDLDRESSIERRMRLDYERSTEEREDFEIVKRLMNEEQRQLDEMDRENQEIHLMAKQERYKKPMVERQGSDVGSEEDKLLWSGMLNKDSAKDDFEEGNALRYDDDYKYSMDQYKNESDINRSYTPQTNQETQSSGSSGTRRRKGDLDDEDDYFLRENRISNEIHIGDYISSAIKEGLSTPEDNALAQMGGFDRSFDQGKHELTPEIPSRSLKRKGKKPQEPPVDDEESSWQQQNVASFKDFYKTFPPDRPVRKQKKSECESELADDMDLSEDHQIPDSYNADDLIEDMNDRELFYHQQILKGLDHPDMIGKDDFDNEMDYNISNLPIPPTPPRRRKKKIRSPQPVVNLRNDKVQERAALAEQNVQVFRYDQKFVPLAREEKFTPTPPRRTRSRSQISAHTLDDADSFKHDSIETFNVQDKENGYAQVRKDLPPRPVRRKRSTKSLGERQFATMPHLKRQSETPPPRPAKKYSTIIPNKPPRRKSSGSLVEISQITKNDDDDYEEILDSNQENHDNAAVLRLKSGEIVKRMKDRPLPPPPRPKREHKKHKKDEGGDDEDKFDKDDGAEKITGQLSVETDFSDEQLHEVKESLPRQDSDFSEHEKVVEVEVSTQTDPVLDEDFVCDEDEDCDIDEFLSSDGKMKTLEDILKEEQEAELERARQLAEAENLSRGIQRFRDSSQRSMSEKSGKTDRTSGSRSRSLSRPITPSAVVVERKKSSPIIFQSQEQTLTEAGLFIHPITYDDYGIPHSDDEQNETAGENLDVNNNFDAIVAAEEIIQEVSMSTVNFIEDKPAEEDDFDAEMQRKIEEMIESVMSSAQEEVEWLRASNDEIQSSPVESSVRVEISQPEETPEPVEQADEPPLPPPRRKSTVIEEPVKKETKKEVLPEFDESQIVTVTKTRTQYTQREPEVVPETDANNEVEVCEEPCVQRFVKRPVIHEDGHVMEDHHKTNEALSDHHKTNETLPAQLTSHMHLSSLEIDNLSVTSLNAGRISASEIDSNTIVTNDLEVKSTNNVPSPRSIEFPPGFIEEIVERVRNAERAEHQTDEHPPARPPLPAQFNFPELTTNIPPSFYELRDPSEEEVALPQMPHRRKKQPSKRKGSTSEEDNQQREQRMRNRGGDQSVMGLGGQFARACGNAIKESGGNLMAVLRASCKDENKRDLHIALIILIIIVAGLVLMGMGDKSVHHHHWDFFNPPDNHGR